MEVVQMLWKEEVISKETLHDMNKSGGVLGEFQLKALCTTVQEDSHKLIVFASVLLKLEETVVVAIDILKEYSK